MTGCSTQRKPGHTTWTDRAGRWPFLRSSARGQGASTEQQTALGRSGPDTQFTVACFLALTRVLTWGRASVSKLLRVILFIICIFISHLWPATTSHCHFRFWRFWTLLLPLKKWMFFKGVKGMWLWRGLTAGRTFPGPSGSGSGLSCQPSWSSVPSHYHHSAEVPHFGRNRKLPSDLYSFPGGHMALEQQTLEFLVPFWSFAWEKGQSRVRGKAWADRECPFPQIFQGRCSVDLYLWEPHRAVCTSWWVCPSSCLLWDWPAAWRVRVRRQDAGSVSLSDLGQRQPSQRWEQNAQTWLHIPAEWCNDVLLWVLLNSSRFGSLSSLIFLSLSQWLHQRN